jgi:hypothetical protein
VAEQVAIAVAHAAHITEREAGDGGDIVDQLIRGEADAIPLEHLNSGLCRRPTRSSARKTRAICQIEPLPAASRRFIAYSGEVCR